MPKQHLIVAFGGVSPEHEVSVLTAMQAIAALEESNYTIVPLYITKEGRWLTGSSLLELENYKDLATLKQEAVACTFSHDQMGRPILLETEKSSFFTKARRYPADVVLTAFHGSDGENGAFQGTCEMYNIPYTGSGVFASSIGMQKVKAKELCRAHDIPVVEGLDFFESDWEENRKDFLQRLDELGYPLIVKPVNLGSSIGVKRVDTADELIDAVETAFRYDANLMVEKAVAPLMEINCAVLGDAEDARASVCERPLGTTETLSFQDKYQSDSGEGSKGMASADREIPADISEALTQQIKELSLNIFRVFRASGVARIDYLVNRDTESVFFNEINTIPGSFSFYLWEESGLSFREMLEEMIAIAKRRHRRKNGRIRSYETNLLSEKAVKGIKGLKGSK